MKNLMRLWPPKWWYVGRIAARKQDILLFGTIALFFLIPFTFSSARQQRIQKADHVIQRKLKASGQGEVASPADIKDVQTSSSFTLGHGRTRTELFLFLPTHLEDLTCVEINRSYPDLGNYNVHVIPLPNWRMTLQQRALQLSLLDLPNWPVAKLRTVASSADAYEREILTMWNSLDAGRKKRAEQCLKGNDLLFARHSNFSALVLAGQHGYWIHDLSVLNDISQEAPEIAR